MQRERDRLAGAQLARGAAVQLHRFRLAGGEVVIALGLHLAEIGDIGGPPGERLPFLLRAEIVGLGGRPRCRGEGREIDRGAPVVLRVERAELERFAQRRAGGEAVRAVRGAQRGGGRAVDGERGAEPVECLRRGAHVGGEHQRAVGEGDHRRIVRRRLGAELHRQHDADTVARLPAPVEHCIAVAHRDGRGRAVEFDGRALRPAGDAQRDRLRRTPGAADRQRRLAFGWHARVEVKRQPLPVEAARDVEIDVERPRLARVMPVDRVGMLGMALHPRADAAPEAFLRGRIAAPRACRQRHEIDELAGVGPLVREDMVELDAFVEVEPLRLRLPGIEVPGELQHIVAVARLARRLGDALRQLVGLAEMLALRIAADDIAVMMRDAVVEEARGIGMRGIAGQFVQAGEADQLGNLRIGVQPGELVAPGGERVEHRLVADLLRHPQPARVAGQRIGLGIGFVEAAMFGA